MASGTRDPECPVDRFLAKAKGFTEMHTHWNGIVEPKQYINSYFPLAGIEKADKAKQFTARVRQVKNAIVKCLEAPAEELQPEVEGALEHLQTEKSSKKIQRYLQASRQDEEPAVHFDVAYTFRSALRDAALQQAKDAIKEAEKELHGQGKNGPLDILDILGPGRRPTAEAWAAAGLEEEAWPERAVVQKWQNTWQIDIGNSADRYIDNPLAMEAIVSMAKTIIERYCEPEKTPKWRLLLAPSTLHFLHTQKVIETLRVNQVYRAEIDGWHKLDARLGSRAGMGMRGGSALLECMCKQHIFVGIRHGTFPYGHLTLRFLKGLDNRKIFCDGTDLKHLDYWKEELPGVEHKMLYGPEMIGIDIRSPEGSFDNVDILQDIYDALIELADLRRRDRELPLVLRIHVGECNTHNMTYDKSKEDAARDNVQKVLNVVEKIRMLGTLDLSKVSIRLGHVTAMSLSQAVKIRELGLHFELNSSSNLCTRAVANEKTLPVVKVLVAEALWQIISKDSRPWVFTCNTDGGGIMQCTLEEDYLLSLRVAQDFIMITGGKDAPGLCIAEAEDILLLIENKVLSEDGRRELRSNRGLRDARKGRQTAPNWLRACAFEESFQTRMKEILLNGFALQKNHPDPRLAGGYLDR